MAKNRNDYFKLLTEQISYTKQAAKLLSDIFTGYADRDITEQKARMHELENGGDRISRDILTKLYAEFITPIDQEDILRLVQLIDDITDAIDEVVLECYMFHLTALPARAPEFAAMVQSCVGYLSAAVSEFKSFKKPDKLRQHLKDINHAEAEADKLYVEAIHQLFGTETDCKTIIAHKAIYDCLEDCCDQCEHAADLMEQIIMKNT